VAIGKSLLVIRTDHRLCQAMMTGRCKSSYSIYVQGCGLQMTSRVKWYQSNRDMRKFWAIGFFKPKIVKILLAHCSPWSSLERNMAQSDDMERVYPMNTRFACARFLTDEDSRPPGSLVGHQMLHRPLGADLIHRGFLTNGRPSSAPGSSRPFYW
jgi:Uri superfamily endonuclease